MPRIKKIFCPKCKNRIFGHVFLSNNIYKGKSNVICFNGDCDFKMNINEWNKHYPKLKFKDNGFEK